MFSGLLQRLGGHQREPEPASLRLVESDRPAQPGPEWFPVQSGEELLLGAGQVAELETLAGVTAVVFREYYLQTLIRIAEFAQELPASEAHHHAGRRGLLTHLLEVAVGALRRRRAHFLPPGATPEEMGRESDAWTFAVFTAALLHDIGKPVVDQRIELYLDSGDRAPWNPWAGSMVAQGAAWYRMEFARGGGYPLHERIVPLLAPQVLPPLAYQWIVAEPQRLSAWLGALNSDSATGGELYEITGQADQESTTASLTGTQARVPGAHVVPLFERLVSALRRRIDKDHFPMNRNGAGGWLIGNDLWLVSKRVADELREAMISEGQSGVPTKNHRIFDELLARGVLLPTPDERAVWSATVQGDGWSHELTLIRARADRIWSDEQQRPAQFQGTVNVLAGAAAPAETHSPPAANAIPSHPPQAATSAPNVAGSEPPGGEPAPGSNEAALALFDSLPPDAPPPSTQAIESAAPTESREPIGSVQPTPVQPLANSSPPPSPPAASPPAPISSATAGQPESLGRQFLAWLQDGVNTGQIAVNGTGARVHVVHEGVLLISPVIFRMGGSALNADWKKVQAKFLKLKLHQQHGRINIVTYRIDGGTDIKGLLIGDPRVLFPDERPPVNGVLQAVL